ncbi:MAG TPA: hypothetical protein ENO14_04485 [Chromatiales bacterium]|nr:hypothetical protein [Chromatiales bacterium]
MRSRGRAGHGDTRPRRPANPRAVCGSGPGRCSGSVAGPADGAAGSGPVHRRRHRPRGCCRPGRTIARAWTRSRTRCPSCG